MRRQHGLVFDDYIVPKTLTDTDFYTSLALNEVLATSNQLAAQILVDNCKCGTASTITLVFETSPNGEVWLTKTGGAVLVTLNLEINSRSVSGIGWDTGVLPSMQFSRLRVSWAGFSLPASARVRVYVTTRDPAMVRDPLVSERARQAQLLKDLAAKRAHKDVGKDAWQEEHSDNKGHTQMGKDPSPGHHGKGADDS